MLQLPLICTRLRSSVRAVVKTGLGVFLNYKIQQREGGENMCITFVELGGGVDDGLI